jgi:hypothetical protein
VAVEQDNPRAVFRLPSFNVQAFIGEAKQQIASCNTRHELLLGSIMTEKQNYTCSVCCTRPLYVEAFLTKRLNSAIIKEGEALICPSVAGKQDDPRDIRRLCSFNVQAFSRQAENDGAVGRDCPLLVGTAVTIKHYDRSAIGSITVFDIKALAADSLDADRHSFWRNCPRWRGPYGHCNEQGSQC